MTKLGMSTTANALGAGFQFNDDGSSKAYDWGKAGVSFAANAASTVASTYASTAMYESGVKKLGPDAKVADAIALDAGSSFVGQQFGRAANVLTASLLGDKNAYQAYMPQGLGSALGTYLGDQLATRVNHNRAPSQPYGSDQEPLREILGGAAIITGRREENGFSFLDGLLDAGASFSRAGAAVGSGLAAFFTNTAQRIGNLVTGEGFNTNSQVVAREILKLPEDQRYEATLFAVNNDMVNLADLPFTIAPVESAVQYADNLKSKSASFGKNGANANKIIRALAATYQSSDEAAVRDSLLKANGVTSVEALQAKIAKGEAIQFAEGQEWVSGVTQKVYSGLGAQATTPTQTAQQPRFYWQTIQRANGQQSADIRQSFWNWLKGGGKNNYQPEFIDQHELTKYGIDGRYACVVNSIRTNLESLEGRPADSDFYRKLVESGATESNGYVNNYNKAAESFGSSSRWSGYKNVADDSDRWKQFVQSELAAGRHPTIRVTGHSMNIVDSEVINGKFLFQVKDGVSSKPEERWTHVDPNSRAQIYIGYDDKGRPDGSHGLYDIGWQMKRRDRSGEMLNEMPGRKNVMWGLGYYAR